MRIAKLSPYLWRRTSSESSRHDQDRLSHVNGDFLFWQAPSGSIFRFACISQRRLQTSRSTNKHSPFSSIHKTPSPSPEVHITSYFIKMNMSFDAIRASVRLLPQELQDMIYDFVFTAPSGPIELTDRSSHTIRTSLKLLSISRASRATYATSYYSREHIFRANMFMWSIGPMTEWVNSLPSTHRAVLSKISLMRLNNKTLSSNEYLAGIIQSCKEDITLNLGPVIDGIVVYELAGYR